MSTSSTSRLARAASFVLVAAALAWTSSARAQTYPDKAIRFVVPYPAGASTDQVARIFSSKLQERYGQPIVIDNRGGAGGTVGAEQAAKAPPDGYTILIGEPGSMAINESFMKKIAYSPTRDFIAVGEIVSMPVVLLTNPKTGIKTLADLKTYGKGAPIPFGSAGTGTLQHLSMELLKRAMNVDMVHVAYRGGAPAISDLLGNHIPLLVLTLPTAIQAIKAGQFVPIAALGKTRIKALPDLPTAAEQGYPSLDVRLWEGIFVPAGTPRPVVTRLNEMLRATAADPSVVKAVVDGGMEVSSTTPAEFDKTVRTDVERWGKIVREAGISAE